MHSELEMSLQLLAAKCRTTPTINAAISISKNAASSLISVVYLGSQHFTFRLL